MKLVEERKNNEIKQKTQSFLDFNIKSKTFAKTILESFLSADIPLYKLRNSSIKNLFNSLGHPIPSETTIRSSIDEVFSEEIERLKNFFVQKEIFLVIDETSSDGVFYTNILAGLIESPQITFNITLIISEHPPIQIL